jgi:hypothetical protein
VPNVGGLLGANTAYVDTFSGALGVRITDYHTLGSSPVQPSYQIDPGGSAAINFMDASDTYFYVSDTGSEIEPFTWNPATMQATRMYVSKFPSTNGMRINYCSAGPEFSYTTPGLMYCPEAGAHTSRHLDLYSYDLTSSTPPVGTLIADLGTIPACAPPGVTYDGFVQWADPFTVSADDQTFATALSLTGGQGTGAYVVAWNRNGSCHWWNTTTGTTDAGSVTGVTDEFYLHNARLSLDDNWVTVSRAGCVLTCSNHTVYSWQIGTTNATASVVQNSGHWTVGYNHIVNDSTSPHQQSIQLAPASSPGSKLCLADCGAASPPPYANWDTHFSWQNANLGDSNLIMGSSFTPGIEIPTQAWNNEVMGYDPGGSGTVWRFGRTYITANPSAVFAAVQGIGSVSADGNWFAFASDWGCQLGSKAGGATGTTSPYDCRADVFMLSLTGAGAAPVASLSPTSLSFGSEYVGSTSPAQTVTLTNPGNAALSISSVTIGQDYTETNDCGSTVAAGGSCSFSVSFAPTTAGPLDEFLQIADNASGSPQSVALTGSGVALASQVTISPATLAFGSQLLGTASASQSATLTSTGNAPLTITSVVPGGDFTLATTATSCPYAGGMVNPGASCTLDVTFTPTAMGSRSGAVAVTDNAAGSPQSVNLTGTGIGNAVPQIDLPVVPGSAAPGTSGLTLTVNGTGFAAGASVEWNGSALATNWVSGRQVTAVVPAAEVAAAGTASVTVLNPAPGGGASNEAFFPITNPTSSVWFGRADVATGNGPQWVGTGDFNQDGKPDLAVANSTDGTISILLGNGDGTFAPQPVVSVGPGVVFGAVGDLNGDGIPDLALADSSNNTVSILLGTGGGAFAPPASVATGNGPVALALADFNADGTLDLAVANNIDNTISILPGNGDGTFSTSLAPVSVGNGPVSLVAADLNGDGVPDLAVANSADGTISILFGNGDGTFTSQPVISLAPGLSSVIAADLNGDGLLDLAAANSTTNSIAIALSAGNGVFSSATSLNTGNGPSALASGDWNGDGILDLAVTNATDSALEVLLGNGDGTFQAGITSGAGSGPVSMAAADFNGDGRLDAATADLGLGSLSVLLQAPQVSLSPPGLDFGNQPTGTSSTPQTTTLTNTGTAALAIGSIAVSGANGPDFSPSNTCGSTLAPGAACTITVTFTPAATGTRTAAVTITDNAADSPESVALSGTGTTPAASLMPATLSFGSQQVGTSSMPQNITLTDTGTAPLTITAIAIGGGNPGDFNQTNTCPSTLAAGSNCVISVTFSPTATGSRSATVSVTDNASDSPQAVSLSGTGTQPAVSLSPASLTFSAQAVGTQSAGKPITLTNTGTATLTLTSIGITGANSGDFLETNTCGTSVAAGGNCSITVTFGPTAAGTRSATLSVTDNAPGSPQTASLSGTGTAPAVTLSPTSLTFGVQKIGTSSATQKVTLTNTGTSALTITSITMTGSNAADFSQTNTCPLSPSTLAAGKACTLTVAFKPTAGGTRQASMAVADNAAGSPQSVSLTGTGTAVQLSPTSLSFGSEKVGKSSSTKTITLTNLGSTTLSITSIGLTGTNSGDFSQTNTCGSSVGAGQGCSISVTFKPLAKGTRTASVSVTDNGGASPQTVAMSGTGS